MSQRIGRTVIDEGAEFEVIWPCAETAYVPPAELAPRLVTRRIPTYPEGRQILMELLEQQPAWRTKELASESMLPHAMFWALIQHLKRNNLTMRPDRGWVALRRVSVAA